MACLEANQRQLEASPLRLWANCAQLGHAVRRKNTLMLSIISTVPQH